MDIAYMREFLVLAKHLNYTSAAAELFISQPTLTRHVNALEDEYGTRLLNRQKHLVELTPSGELAVKAFERIVQEHGNLLEDIARIAHDEYVDLRLGMVYYGCSAYFGYPMLKAAAKHFPELHISTVTAQSQQIYKYLHRGAIDVGLTVTSDIYDDEMERYAISTAPLYAVMHPNHPLAKSASLTVEELARQKIILNRHAKDKPHHIIELFKRHGLALDNVEYIDHIDELIPALSWCDGIFIGSMLLMAMPAGLQTLVPIEAEDFTIDVSLVYLKDNTNPGIEKLKECANMIAKPPM